MSITSCGETPDHRDRYLESLMHDHANMTQIPPTEFRDHMIGVLEGVARLKAEPWRIHHPV